MDLLQTISDVDHDDGSPPSDRRRGSRRWIYSQTKLMRWIQTKISDTIPEIDNTAIPQALGSTHWVCWTYSPHRVLGYYSNHQTINSNTQIADKYSGINHSTLTHHYSTYHTTPDSHTSKIIPRLDTIQHTSVQVKITYILATRIYKYIKDILTAEATLNSHKLGCRRTNNAHIPCNISTETDSCTQQHIQLELISINDTPKPILYI